MSEQPQQFSIQKIYLKDASFETPHTPQIFQEKWDPQGNIELNSDANKLDDNNNYEVTIVVTVTTKIDDKVAYLCEVKQSGIFNIQGFNEEQLKHALGSYAPGVLFPYAREVVSDLVAKGGFPQMLLAPVNFDAIFAQRQQQEAQQQAEGSAKH